MGEGKTNLLFDAIHLLVASIELAVRTGNPNRGGVDEKSHMGECGTFRDVTLRIFKVSCAKQGRYEEPGPVH